MTLSEIRKKIDALDAKLLELLNERADLVHEIGLVKKRDGVGVYAPEREEQLLQSLMEKNRGRLPETAIRAIYREIISASYALEKGLTIACCGGAENPTHRAARQKFGTSVSYVLHPTSRAVCDAVALGDADYGVVPMGDATEQLRQQFDGGRLKICAEIMLESARFWVIGRADAEVEK